MATSNILKCKYCGREFTDKEIYRIHLQKEMTKNKKEEIAKLKAQKEPK